MTVQVLPHRRLYYRAIGENIRSAREAKGWSQLRLGMEIEVSGVAVSYWEGGKRRPNAYDLDRLEAVLGARLRP